MIWQNYVNYYTIFLNPNSNINDLKVTWPFGTMRCISGVTVCKRHVIYIAKKWNIILWKNPKSWNFATTIKRNAVFNVTLLDY